MKKLKIEYLLDGSAPHDILRILGEKLTEYFVSEVQEVYRLRCSYYDKHIETIVRQMLKDEKRSRDPELLTEISLLQINFINEQLEKKNLLLLKEFYLVLLRPHYKLILLFPQPHSKKRLEF